MLSLTGRRWTSPLLPHVFQNPRELAHALAMARGLTDVTDGVHAKLSSPFLFPEMGRACDRIRTAAEHHERIVIFGDYDADGVTATALLMRALKRHGAHVEAMLPHRERDGYGLKRAHIDRLSERGATLVITVDTGIVAHAEVVYAGELGIEIIVTDHHAPLQGRPPAHSVIHPLIPSAFAYADLAGAGVAFHLVRALEETFGNGEGEAWPGIEEDLLLATIGTIADMVPLTGENRVLVRAGLRAARHLPPESPLSMLLQQHDGTLTAGSIGYVIAPLLNAAGRIDDPQMALTALLEGGGAIEALGTLNEQRKALTAASTKRAEELITAAPFLCVRDDTFLPGLLGLIASHLTRTTGKPSLVATMRDGTVMASLRSTPECGLTDVFATREIRALLTTAGGHHAAGGCTCTEANYPLVVRALEDYAHAHWKNVTGALLQVTAEVAPHSLGAELHTALAALEPFGRMNDEPLLLLSQVRLTDVRTVGMDGGHLIGKIGALKAIGFRLGHLHDQCNVPRDLLCRVHARTWNGSTSVELTIEDLR